MTRITAQEVNPGEEFSFAGRWYQRAQEGEESKHPASGLDNVVLAYSLQDNKNRVPVSVRADLPVFVPRKVS